MKLEDRLWELIEGCADRMNDWDARSALGLADSFRRGGKADLSNIKIENGAALNRDGLAFLMIEALMADEKSDKAAALAEARRRLNAPYANDPVILGMRAKQAERVAERNK